MKPPNLPPRHHLNPGKIRHSNFDARYFEYALNNVGTKKYGVQAWRKDVDAEAKGREQCYQNRCIILPSVLRRSARRNVQDAVWSR